MKKIINFTTMFVLMLFCITSVSALTKSDLDYILDDFERLEVNSLGFTENETIREYIKENENPSVDIVDDYIFWKIGWDETSDGKYKYILNPDFYEKTENPRIQIPATLFEAEVEKHFNVTSDFYNDLHENFDADMMGTSEYKKIDDEYYYYVETMYGAGYGSDVRILPKGYKDLSNNLYQVYYYMLEWSFDEEELSNENNVFIEISEYNYETEKYEVNKYLVEGYLTTKIEYKGGNIKYYSYEEADENSIPEDKDLVLYKNMLDEETDNDQTNKEETEKEEVKEINVKDEVWKTFLTELSKVTKNIEYDENNLKVTDILYDDFTYEISFSYSNGILELKESSNKNELYSLINKIINIELKKFTYGEKPNLIASMLVPYDENEILNPFKLKNDGIEYVSKLVVPESMKDCTACIIFPTIDSFSIDLKNGLNMENLKKFHKGINAYKYLNGEDQKYNPKSDKKLTFRIDADMKLFEKIYIDGEEVDKKYYTVTEGSTIITFTDEYAKKLSNGDHTLKATFTDGKQAIAEFTVDENVKNPDTGISMGYGMMLLLVIIGIGSYVVVRKKSKFPRHN